MTMSNDLERAVCDAAFYVGIALLVYSFAGAAGAGAALVGAAVYGAVTMEDDDE